MDIETQKYTMFGVGYLIGLLNGCVIYATYFSNRPKEKASDKYTLTESKTRSNVKDTSNPSPKPPAPEGFKEPVIIPVESPDDMRQQLMSRIMQGGKPMQATVDWDEETGKGIATITECEEEA